eukprot:CAMPEP_0204149854 /NCGR_PEP_ID=MMETSP0361-20130328/24761_1 /ASSEMBLY_ACC=CAM_ASM_000343 /TAXON_ID=268821 /ORGANISM="Scrippsiella Hangoei, Strain SHTV-5" /LENGTH=152 /DNA_ID=CAMNT_0051104427 /DNA_START=1817 /DNA_END=2276 /DNA_ORIENTATION=+
MPPLPLHLDLLANCTATPPKLHAQPLWCFLYSGLHKLGAAPAPAKLEAVVERARPTSTQQSDEQPDRRQAIIAGRPGTRGSDENIAGQVSDASADVADVPQEFFATLVPLAVRIPRDHCRWVIGLQKPPRMVLRCLGDWSPGSQNGHHGSAV